MELATLFLILLGTLFLGFAIGYAFCLLKLKRLFKQDIEKIHQRYVNRWEMEFGVPKQIPNIPSNVIDIRSKKRRKIFRTYENKDD